MSLIGPRPYLVEERPLIGPELSTILQMRPGITGLWQVLGKSELPFRQRVRLEAWYVRHWSPGLDLAILIRTVRAILSGRTWE
jgi:lipopolysaccharide/colanic/teichoic acid biosynthesis glycosyltransferase